jgi:hypothetical protein
MNISPTHNWAAKGFDGALDFMARQHEAVERLPKRDIHISWRRHTFVFDRNEPQDVQLKKYWSDTCRAHGITRILCTVRRRRYGKQPLKVVGQVGRVTVFTCYLPVPKGPATQAQFDSRRHQLLEEHDGTDLSVYSPSTSWRNSSGFPSTSFYNSSATQSMDRRRSRASTGTEPSKLSWRGSKLGWYH